MQSHKLEPGESNEIVGRDEEPESQLINILRQMLVKILTLGD